MSIHTRAGEGVWARSHRDHVTLCVYGRHDQVSSIAATPLDEGDLLQLIRRLVKLHANIAKQHKFALVDAVALVGARRYVKALSGGLVPWPENEPPRHNCDMWTGPCACGAWHREGK